MRILLVADNLFLGEALRDHVAAMGHDTVWRVGFIEAMIATVSDAFDLILLDLRLPVACAG
jgi:DNA-binding response OmpR family regulator